MTSQFLAECRAEVTGSVLSGHAAVFGQTATVPGHYEQIGPTAFRSALGRDDVVALRDHNPSLVLGRSSSGTLRLDVDPHGLAFEIDLPEVSYAQDLKELIARGDVNGMSFGFIPGADEWSTAPDGRKLRTHTDVKRLLDVSVVTYPAYQGTDVTLRSLDFSVVPSYRSRLITARAAVLFRKVNR